MFSLITKRKYPWIGKQDWTNIVFLHWPVEPDILRDDIPESFELDLFDEKAWISVVFFQATGTRGRWMPKCTSLPAFHQVNVRTYVYHEKDAERGVYFLQMYTDSLISIIGAKNGFQLPFQYAAFSSTSNQWIQKDHDKQILFSTQYSELGIKLEENKLNSFLTERYCIWNIKGRNIIKIPILHKIWELEQINVKIKDQHLFPLTEMIDSPPKMCHYSPFQQSVIFPYETIGKI